MTHSLTLLFIICAFAIQQKVTILNKKDDQIRFYQSMQRIAERILSSQLNEEPGSSGRALMEVLTQLVKDSCSWVSYIFILSLIYLPINYNNYYNACHY